jgi:putative spermidine/putrescine transport system permease protein
LLHPICNLRVATLLRKLWDGIRFDSSPEPAAVSVMLIGVTCIVITVGIALAFGRRRNAFSPLRAGARSE